LRGCKFIHGDTDEDAVSSSRSADGKEERLATRPGVGRIVARTNSSLNSYIQ